jgi:NAD(P)-dependent dehydrogenase (short-subunit alcohol dehydrogenase family)
VRFTDRVAVVTGGASGIGRAIAIALADEGASTWVLDRDAAALDALTRTDNRIHGLRIDFGGDQSGDAIAEKLLADAGRPDLIVNNVGIMTSRSALHVGLDDWERVLRVNLTTPFFFSQRLANELRAAGRPGSILFISSLHATRMRSAPHYSASKAAVEMAAKELARDLAPEGIRVNIIRPGWIETRAETDAGAARRPWLARRRGSTAHSSDVIPAGYRGVPDDLSGMAIALLDDGVSGYVTGAVVNVDGGLSLHSWL